MTMIGWGSFVVEEDPKGALKNSVIKYIIQSDGIKFYDLSSSDSRPTFENGETSGTAGLLSLVSLPASPKNVSVRLTKTVDDVTLHLQQTGMVAQRSSTFFENLDITDITFTESKSGGGLQVTGKVHLRLFGRSGIDIELSPELTPAGLVFNPAASQSFEIAQLGRLTINSLEVGRNDPFWSNLEALYTFDEISGNVVWDNSGNSQIPLNLEINDPIQNPIQRIPTGGVLLGNGEDNSRHQTVLESKAEGTKEFVEACQLSNALTIAAWIRPARELAQGEQQRPARIVSLSEDTNQRNFTLGQDIDKAGNNRYIVRLRRNGGDENGNPPLVSKPGLLSTADRAYVVFTRGDDTSGTHTGKIYINGEDQTDLNPDNLDAKDFSADLSGDFSSWSKDYSLLLGNEKTKDRSWDGEIHQMALYSRALSEEEIKSSYKYRYFPKIQLDATLTLNQVPAPFVGEALPAKIDLDTNQFIVEQADLDLAATNFLRFTEIKYIWEPSGSNQEQNSLSGSVKATLWGNPVTFDLALTADKLTLSRSDDNEQVLALNDIDPRSPLGNIQLQQLTLSADRIPDSNWTFETDGQVTFAVIPPPLEGPFPVEIFLDGPSDAQKLWFSISPSAPLPVVKGLYFEQDQANLRFARDNGGWQVQPDLRDDRGGISVPLFGEPRPLTAQLFPTDTAKALVLEWTATADKQLGKLNLSHFRLNSVSVLGELFWQLEMQGQVPLSLPDQGVQVSVLKFSTEDGKILGDPNNAQQPRRLEGRSQLQSLGEPIFDGNLGLKEDSFLLNGQFTLFPDWSTLQVNGDSLIKIDLNDGQVHFDSPVQVTLPDFVLQEPKLELNNGSLTLIGKWLGKDVSFSALHRANQTVWVGLIQFDLPFSVVPGHYDREAKDWSYSYQQETSGYRQMMRTNLVSELSASGFFARINGSYTVENEVGQDETYTSYDIEPEKLQLFTPPATRNTILRHIIQHVDRFMPVRRYFFTVSDDQKPWIYLGDYNSSTAQENTTTLPQLFKSDESISPKSSTAGVFTLKKDDATRCTLTIKPGNILRNQVAIKADYDDFIGTTETTNQLIDGALTLLKARIAERIPSLVDDILYYYYGFNPSKKKIDLQAGMRLRVEYQAYQFVHPVDRTAENGFISSGTAYYSLQFHNKGKASYLSFDPFLSQVSFQSSGANSEVAGLIDLLQTKSQKPFYRLLYPDTVASGNGRIGSERATVLLGANTFHELEDATVKYFESQSVPNGVDTIHFRGRAVVVPEIVVFVQEQPEYVAVGTTLQQLAERYGHAALRRRLQRLVHEGVNNTPGYHFVNPGNDAAALDLPLVQGDRLYF